MASQKAYLRHWLGKVQREHKEMLPKIQAADVYSRPGTVTGDYNRHWYGFGEFIMYFPICSFI